MTGCCILQLGDISAIYEQPLEMGNAMVAAAACGRGGSLTHCGGCNSVAAAVSRIMKTQSITQQECGLPAPELTITGSRRGC